MAHVAAIHILGTPNGIARAPMLMQVFCELHCCDCCLIASFQDRARGSGGGGRGRDTRHSESSGSWGAPPPVPSKASTVQWDSSSWGPTSSSTQHSTAESDGWGRSWGGKSASSSQSSPKKVADTRRKETTQWPVAASSDDSGWDPPPPSHQKQSTNDSWGSQSGQGSSSGWGSGASAWGSTDAANAAAWGVPIPSTSKPSDEQKNLQKKLPLDREPTKKFGTSNDQGSAWGKDPTDNRIPSNEVKSIPLPSRKPPVWGVSPQVSSPIATDDSGWGSLPSSHQQQSTNDTWGSQSGLSSAPGWGSGASAWGTTDAGNAAAWGVPNPPTSKPSNEQKNIPRDGELTRKFGTSNDQKGFGGKGSTDNRTPDILSNGAKPIPLPSRAPLGWGVSPQVPSPVAIPDNPRDPSTRKLNIRTDSLGTTDSVLSSVPNSASSTRRDPTVPRNQSFGSTMRLLQSAVRLELEYNEAVELGERWKRTQASSQYSRAPLLARTKMDKIRATCKQEETKLKKRLDEAIKNLSDSPYLSSRLNPGLNVQQLKLYATQLKDWLNELEVYRRLKFPTPSHTAQDTLPDVWKNIEDSLAASDEIAERIMEQTTEAKTGAIRDFTDAKTKALLDAHMANNPRKEVDSYGALASDANTVGASLGTQAEHVAELIGSSHGDQAPIEHLQAKLADELNAQEQVSSLGHNRLQS